MRDFHELYERYAAQVQRFAYALCGDVQQVQDICSETFVRAWLNWGRLRQPTVRAYLFAIARNLYLQDLRRSKRQVELHEDLQDGATGPHTAAEHSEIWAWTQRAMQRLSESERAALMLRSVEEMSYEEIAATLKISLAAAKVNVHRARLKMVAARSELEE
jgi:RNA polymerase sigma factor (sigma-70 family)